MKSHNGGREEGDYDTADMLEGLCRNWAKVSHLWMNSVEALGEGVSRETFGDDLIWIDPDADGLLWLAHWRTWHPNYRTLHTAMQRLARQAPMGVCLLIGRLPRRDGVLVCMARADYGTTRSTIIPAIDEQSSRLLDCIERTNPLRCRDTLESIWVELGRARAGRNFVARMTRHLQNITENLLHVPSHAEEARSRLALLLVCRTLFVAFLMEQKIISEDAARRIRRRLIGKDAACIHHEVLRPLFFDALNRSKEDRIDQEWAGVPFLNGGLFEQDAVERRWPDALVPDHILRPLGVDLLLRFRISSSESRHPSTVNPEILGTLFEAWMSEETRKGSGTFYTPPGLVDRISEVALRDWLQRKSGISLARLSVLWEPAGNTASMQAELLSVQECRSVLNLLKGIKCLDPACGSGAFLLGMAQQIARIQGHLRKRLGIGGNGQELMGEIVANSIYGVDLSETAVFLCQLRLWLLCVSWENPEVQEHDRATRPLPSLVHNLRTGNALLNTTEICRGNRITYPAETMREIREQVRRLQKSQGTEKVRAMHGLHHAQRMLAETILTTMQDQIREDQRATIALSLGEQDTSGHGQSPDSPGKDAVERLRRALFGDREDFSFDARIHFSTAFEKGGFDLIIGNPPWLPLSRVAKGTREAVRARYSWCRADGKRNGFGVQADLSMAFLQQGLNWLHQDGLLAMLIPSKVFTCRYASTMRRDLCRGTNANLLRIENLEGNASGAFQASVYPALLSFSNAREDTQRGVHDSESLYIGGICSPPRRTHPNTLSVAHDPEGPWFFGDDRERKRLSQLLNHPSVVGDRFRVRQGLKTGNNRATLRKRSDQQAGDLWRPILRGRDLQGALPRETRELVLFAHDPVSGQPRSTLDGAVLDSLQHLRGALKRRSDLRKGDPWWRLFRVFPEALGWRVVWPDIAQSLMPTVLPPVVEGGPLVLNSAYLIGCDSEGMATRLAAWLRTWVIQDLVNAIAEPALNGYLRLQSHIVECLPLPEDVLSDSGPWASAVELAGASPSLRRLDELSALATEMLTVARSAGIIDA